MRWWQIRKRCADLERELQSDLELEEEEQGEDGLPPEEAHYAARRAFGNPALIREQTPEAWGWAPIERFGMVLRYALRRLYRSPGFAIATVLTLAVGIGSTTAIFSLVDATLLRPLPFPGPDRLVWVSQQDHSLPGIAPEALSYPDYFDWRAQNHTIEGLASYTGGTVNMEIKVESQRLDVQTVSANFFDVLGATPILGQDFQWREEKPGNRAVMLSYSFWQQQFGSARDIVGKSITVDGRSYTVAGVMPREFRFPFNNPAPVLWKSLADAAEGKSPPTKQRGFDALGVIGCLRPAVTLAQAQVDLSVIAGNLAREYPDNNKQYGSALVEPELTHMTGDSVRLCVCCLALSLWSCCWFARTSAACCLRMDRGAVRSSLYEPPSEQAAPPLFGNCSSNRSSFPFAAEPWARHSPTV